MTTAHKPTYHPAVGSATQGGYRYHTPRLQFSSRDMPGQTTLKYRQLGQNSAEEVASRDLKAELDLRESIVADQRQAELRKQLGGAPGPEPVSLIEYKPTTTITDAGGTATFDDADDTASSSNSDSSSDESDDDEEAELLRELERIKAEREAERLRKEADARDLERKEAEDAVLTSNPLLASNLAGGDAFTVKRRWGDDVVFKNQAADEPTRKKRFINDTIRNDFHVRFLHSMCRWLCCCCCCCLSQAKATFELTDALRDLAEEMQLTDVELQRLFQVFCSMDTAGKGAVSCDELFNHINLRRSPFLDLVFDYLDTDKDQLWNFYEWLTAMARINLYTYDRLVEFMFSMYDTNSTGYVAGDSLVALMQASHGHDSMLPLAVEKAIDLYDEKHDGKLDLLEFRMAKDYYPILVWPMFELQIKVQTAVLGIRFWEDLFVRVHPELENHYYDGIADDIRQQIVELSHAAHDLVITCLPFLKQRTNKSIAAVNLRKHDQEKFKIQDNAHAKIAFDGIEVVVEKEDAFSSGDEDELTDNEDCDTAMYMPKNAPASSYQLGPM